MPRAVQAVKIRSTTARPVSPSRLPGGLVGQQQPRPVDQGAGQGHALLLAARQLARIVGHPMLQPDLGQKCPRRRERVAVAGKLQRQGHVLECGHGRDQVEGLEQDADPVAAEQRQAILVETAQIDAFDRHPAARRPLDATDDRHQAGLAGAGRTHHAYAGAGFDQKIDAAQDCHRPRGARKGKMHIGKLDHRQGPDPSVAGPHRRATAVEMVQGHRRSKAWMGLACLLAVVATACPAWACRLSVLGDSLAAGYGVAEADAFPVRLEQALKDRGVACTVLNAGVSGDTSAGGLARLDWVLGDRPTHLLVELGGNDALRGLPVEQMRENINQIVRTARRPRCRSHPGRHAGTAQSRAQLWRCIPASLSRCGDCARRAALPVLLGWRGTGKWPDAAGRDPPQRPRRPSDR